MVQPFIVTDVDAGPQLAIERYVRLYIELGRLALRLVGDCQRRHDQHRPIGMAHYILGPHKLLERLTKAAVLDQRAAPDLNCPLSQMALEVLERRW